MANNSFMDKLVKKFEANFDIEFNKRLCHYTFDFAAEFNQRSAKYMLMKNTEIYAFKNFEYVFYKNLDDNITREILDDYKTFLKESVDGIVNLDEEHMSSVITLIFSGNRDLDEDTEKAFRKFKFHKSFTFGFKGWVNAKLIYINTETGKIVTNKYAKGDKESFSMIS